MASVIVVVQVDLLFMCEFQGTEHWAEWHVAFNQTGDDYTVVHLDSDFLRKPHSVVRRNYPGQGLVTYSGVDRCITTWMCQSLQGKHVLVRTDNTTVVSYVKSQGGTHSLPLLHLTQILLMWGSEHLASPRAVHILGYLNGGADLLSRGDRR